MKRYFGFVAAALLLLASTQSLAGDPLKDALQARDNEWSAAFNAGDAAAVGALYEEEAVLVAPGMEPVQGRAAIEVVFGGFFGVLKDVQLVTDYVRPIGEGYAVEIGHSLFNEVQADGSTIPASDNYVVVWHKGEDGVWRLITDTFNRRKTGS